MEKSRLNSQTAERFSFDTSVREKHGVFCGIDEAGRGPLAGSVYAAAVIFPEGVTIEGLNDSKKLSEKKRELLFEEITEKALAYAIASASPEEIDERNILGATFLAMQRAVGGLSVSPAFALVDGNRLPALSVPAEALVGGDGISASIAAASILAKVTRDRAMVEMDRLYPEYGFAKHKGYGTKLHYEMLKRYGMCPEHRRSFFKKHPI